MPEYPAPNEEAPEQAQARRTVGELVGRLRQASDSLPLTAQMAVAFSPEQPEPGA